MEINNTGSEYQFKPTNKTPETEMGRQFDRTVSVANDTKGINEYDTMLSEEEKSRKKKVFKLAKMEALVHNDDKLSSIYKKILEDNPDEKYGYHWNETVMNIMFNDYVLNNPKYFEKYRNARAVEKKRRDISGINQLMDKDDDEKDNEVKMKDDEESDLDIAANQLDELNIFGGGGFDTTKFAVKPEQAKPNDLFIFDNKSKKLIDIVPKEQMIQAHQKYSGGVQSGAITMAAAATQAQLDMFAQQFKMPKIKFGMSGALEETTTSSSSGQFSGKAIWAKNPEKSRFSRKPIWSGGVIVSESKDYMINPQIFEDFIYLTETFDALSEIDEPVGDLEKQKAIQSFERVKANATKMASLASPEYQNHFNQLLADIDSEIEAIKTSMGLKNKGINENHLNTREEKIDFILQRQPYKEPAELQNLSDREIDMIYKTIESEMMHKTYIYQEGQVAEQQSQFEDKYINAMKADIEATKGQDTSNMSKGELEAKDGLFKGINSNTFKNDKNMNEYGFEDDNMHFRELSTKGSRNKIKVGKLLAFAETNPDENAIQQFAAQHKMDLNQFADAVDVTLKSDLGYDGNATIDAHQTLLALLDKLDAASPQEEPVDDVSGEEELDMMNKMHETGMEHYNKFGKPVEESMIGTPDQSMSMNVPQNQTMANKPGDDGFSSSEMGSGGSSIGSDIGGDMGSDIGLDNELNESRSKLFAMMNKVGKMPLNEERKTPSQLNLDRIKKENEKNTNSEMNKADALDSKKVYGFDSKESDIRKASQWPSDSEFYIEQDFDKVQKDMTSFEELEKEQGNPKDIATSKKRTLTPDEEKQVRLNRGNGMEDIVYDNKPSQDFEDRMKDGMGEDIYKKRQEKIEMKAKMPMYNKDGQPTKKNSPDNKFKDKFNSEDMNETFTGTFHDQYGKRRIVEFKLGEVNILDQVDESYAKVDISGLGNMYSNQLNESKKLPVRKAAMKLMESYKLFYKDGELYAVDESGSTKVEDKGFIEESVFDKMKKLMNYDPSKYLKK